MAYTVCNYFTYRRVGRYQYLDGVDERTENYLRSHGEFSICAEDNRQKRWKEKNGSQIQTPK